MKLMKVFIVLSTSELLSFQALRLPLIDESPNLVVPNESPNLTVLIERPNSKDSIHISSRLNLKVHRGPKIVNVGLVSTGTSSLNSILGDMGLSSLHVADPWTRPSIHETGNDMGLLNSGNLSLTKKESTLSFWVQRADAFHDIPFMAPAIIEQSRELQPFALNELQQQDAPKFVFIATNRSRSSWIKSMEARPLKGGVTFRHLYDIPVGCEGSCVDSDGGWLNLADVTPEQWGEAYDKHQALLEKFNIPTISLEDSNHAKWSILCAALQMHSSDIKEYCNKALSRDSQYSKTNPTTKVRKQGT